MKSLLLRGASISLSGLQIIPTGLQTVHNAAIINLDVTLEQPAKAKEFLIRILQNYTSEVKLGPVSTVISPTAIESLS